MDIKNYILLTISTRVISLLDEYMKHNNESMFYIIVFGVIAYVAHTIYNNTRPIKFMLYRESSITVSSHRKRGNSYGLSMSDPEYVNVYSKYFRAVSYYIINTPEIKIDNLIETNGVENSPQRNTEYILLPNIGSKIRLCKTRNIHFEIVYQNIIENGQSLTLTLYKLSIPALNQVAIIKAFLDECEIRYNGRSNKNQQQTIFEYFDSYTNIDDSTIELMFYEHPFISNKVLGENVFYDEIPQLISYVEQFIPENYEKSKTKYAKMGTPYKATILLYGSPGCGKTSTIKGILNKTGRHGVVVQWSKIKTCREFCSLFRNPVINGQKYNLSEICYIFEDFDANAENIIKTRNELKCKNLMDSIEKLHEENNENDVKKWLERVKENNKIDKLDILTLECVLNVLDGILELHNAMIIFTTNLPLTNIDPAFIRAGRIDYKLNLGNCSVNTIKRIMEMKFGPNCCETIPSFMELKDGEYSPCDVQNACFKNETVEECLLELGGIR